MIDWINLKYLENTGDFGGKTVPEKTEGKKGEMWALKKIFCILHIYLEPVLMQLAKKKKKANTHTHKKKLWLFRNKKYSINKINTFTEC